VEKRTPHCKLSVVKALVKAGQVRATASSYQGARELGLWDLDGMCAVILELTSASFYKSMTTHADHTIWQDVYRPARIGGGRVPEADGHRRRADRVLQGAVTMKCPVCGAAELIHDTRDMPYTYKGETTLIPGVTGDFCPACGEVVLDREHGDRHSEAIGLFHRQVNAAYIDPQYIAQVRKKLDLDQREAAEIFGGGVNAFSRYENGKTKPPLALVKLFKLLDRHPELLNEVRSV
jgi:HTH-type transcriptional regulator / antitoxin MqsA